MSEDSKTASGQNHSLDSLCDELKSLKSAVIVTHVSPDADAIGSSCGLQLLLKSAGVTAVVYLADAIPEYVAGLVGDASVVCKLPDTQVDAVIAVDSASRKRISGGSEELFRVGKRVFNIDHHASNDGWAEINYIDAVAPSSSVIVLRIAKKLGLEISSEVANLLLAGLMDDTGCFRFSNTNTIGFQAASDLVESGACPETVANQLYFSLPERVFRLRALVLAGLEVFAGGKIAFLSVTKEMLQLADARAEDAEGMVDFARSIRGAEVALLLRELDDGWKASLRAKSKSLDVNAIAAQFGGGGHKAAAGCKVPGNLDQARTALVSAVEKALAI